MTIIYVIDKTNTKPIPKLVYEYTPVSRRTPHRWRLQVPRSFITRDIYHSYIGGGLLIICKKTEIYA